MILIKKCLKYELLAMSKHVTRLTRSTKSKYFDTKEQKDNDNDNESNKREFTGDDEKSVKPKVTKRSQKHITVKYDDDSEWTPHNWKVVMSNIKDMRKERDSPVDSMGAEMCFDKDAPFDKNVRFQVLVSLMLSSQTKDQVTHAAMMRLRDKGLSVNTINEMSHDTLGQLIRPVNFWPSKAKNIKRVAEILRDEYDCDIPDTVESLMKLPGVGPKMTHLAMKIAWNKSTGIAVDTHVHRVSNRLGWVRKATKYPEETRVQLESWIPTDLWDEINLILVGFGQKICVPINPKCDECLNNQICPSAHIKNQKSKKKGKSN